MTAAHRATGSSASSATAMTPGTPEDPTIGKLVADVSRDFSSLVHDEIELVKSEIKISAKAGGTGAGLFGAAALLGLLAIVLLSIAFVQLLSMTGLHLAWCYLIVFGAYLLLAGLLAFVGLRKVKQVRAPERAIHQAQETKTLLNRK